MNVWAGLPIFDQILHGAHFVLCLLAVLVALVPLLTAKGSIQHRVGGLIYVPVSGAALVYASFIAWREASLVLFSFNVFCAYLLLSGWRAARAKNSPVFIDWLIPGSLLALAFAVAFNAIIEDRGLHSFYLLFFSLNGFYLSVRDFLLLRQRARWQKHAAFFSPGSKFGATQAAEWLNRHIAGMIGSVLANFSVVALTLLPTRLHWIWPALLVTAAVLISMRQLWKKYRLHTSVPSFFRTKTLIPVLQRNSEKFKRAA